MNHKTSLIGALLLALLIFPLAAWGQAPSVTISVSSCPDLSKTEIQRILTIELRTIARGRKEVESAPTHVSVQCARQTITLKAHVRGKAAVHTEHLRRAASENGDGTERLIAIAAAEIIFSAWVDLLPPQKAIPDSDEEDSDEKEVRPSPKKQQEKKKGASQSSQPDIQKKNDRRKLGLALSVGPHWRTYLAEKVHLFGGELALALSLSRMFYLRIGGTVEWGKARRSTGEVALFASSGLFSLGLEKNFTYVAAGLETGGRFGGSTLKGTPNQDGIRAETVKGGVGGPLIRIRFRTVNKVSARLSMETGYAVYGNIGRVARDNPIHIKGVYLSIALVVGLDLIS